MFPCYPAVEPLVFQYPAGMKYPSRSIQPKVSQLFRLIRFRTSPP